MKKLIFVGLGNPGEEFSNNRHNFGHMVVDHMASKENKTLVNTRYFSYMVIDTQRERKKSFCCKTKTYMNNSGLAVLRMQDFFSAAPEDFVIIYDDIDLPLGTIRIRKGGSSGGHKGMQSVIEKLGTQDIPRIRLGIGPQPDGVPSEKYVLEDFLDTELPVVRKVIRHTCDALNDIFLYGIEYAMNKYNSLDLFFSENFKETVDG
ncbi:MAG: aminoacyl-tRNA hydrolase [Candidatus Neomarinimicrobiota bacterium]|nr:MAG: aminoacyl-tRNA hydrolase [Candidatus Neomarinimicrobiota bacterium]HDN59329.1 aminoacyl-tRNA hydrolase [Candidatus Neomarinimicrobiota bacterium]